MGNLATLGQGFCLSLALVLGINLSPGATQTAANAPKELQNLIAQMEAAANRRDVNGVMQFLSADFSNSDGLKQSSLLEALKKTWERYPNLQYQTQIQSWQQQGDRLVAETITRISGSQQNKGRTIKLSSTMRSRQYFAKQKLVRQEILAERTELTSGANPPQVKIVLPEKVRTGEKFNFDVIVLEPLENDILLGAAQEEKITTNSYVKPKTLDLQVLSAGGIYKLVTAPLLPDNRWLSAIVVRGDGIVQVTGRVIVEQAK